MPDFKHIRNPSEARTNMAAIISQQRARRFVGAAGSADDQDPTRQSSDQLDEAGMRADYLLQTLHATLSAQRTVWSTFEMLRAAVKIEVGHALSDSALDYIGRLAASGMVDMVTHEHVAELLAIKSPATDAQEQRGATTQ